VLEALGVSVILFFTIAKKLEALALEDELFQIKAYFNVDLFWNHLQTLGIPTDMFGYVCYWTFTRVIAQWKEMREIKSLLARPRQFILDLRCETLKQ
jgi:citrate synthase